jgi:hypothetical protein
MLLLPPGDMGSCTIASQLFIALCLPARINDVLPRQQIDWARIMTDCVVCPSAGHAQNKLDQIRPRSYNFLDIGMMFSVF